MATDARIALSGQPINMQAALTGAINQSDAINTRGVRERLLNQQAQAGAMKNAQTQGAYMNQLATGLLNKPLDERAAIVAQQLPFLSQMGINPQEVIGANLSNEGLNRVIAQTKPFIDLATGTQTFQKGASVRYVDEQGNTQVGTSVFDPKTGTVRIESAQLPGQFVSDLGQTVEEKAETEVSTATERAEAVGNVEIEQAVEEIEAVREAELTTAQALSDISSQAKRDEAFSGKQIARLDSAIETGLAAVSQLPDINRGLELLKTVSTGGLDARAKEITDFFGTTSGDVGELNNILASNVLAGLSAFTGAISEGERAFIEKMNTSLSQGTGFNIAQLNRLRNIYKREVDNGLKAATISNDDFAVSIFKDAIKADPTGFAGDVAEKAQSNLDFVNGL